MATQEQFDSIISRIDAATTFLANEIRTLQEEIKAQGLPQAAEDSIVGKLGDLATRLESIGQSTDNPLPDATGSTTPVPLGQGTQESNTDDATAQPPVTNENTGENTPPSDGAEADQSAANATMNPNNEPIVPLPGDEQTNLGDGGEPQVGAQPDANNGSMELNPNADDNPDNDEAVPPSAIGDLNMQP